MKAKINNYIAVAEHKEGTIYQMADTYSVVVLYIFYCIAYNIHFLHLEFFLLLLIFFNLFIYCTYTH